MSYVEKLEIAIHLAMELYPLDILKRQKYIDNFIKEKEKEKSKEEKK